MQKKISMMKREKQIAKLRQQESNCMTTTDDGCSATPSVATTRQTAEETVAIVGDTAAKIADMATKGNTVAAAGDPDYDYYFLKVTSEGVV